MDEVTHVVSKSFQDFNTSVNCPVEVYEEEFGHPEIGPTIIQRSAPKRNQHVRTDVQR